MQDSIGHEDVLKAVQAGLDSEDEREQFAAAKVILGELLEHQEQEAAQSASAAPAWPEPNYRAATR